MNKELKKALKEEFEAPAPTRKREFLRNMQAPHISYLKFVLLQASYIRKWIWVLSFFIFIIAVIGAGYMDKNMLWCISAFVPLLALSVITESGRSELYDMVEFEMSTRFSLKSVVLARLGILGLANFILIYLLIPFAFRNSQTTLFQTSVYIICPYLLTVFLGLWAVRKIRGKESLYLCAGIAICISIGIIMGSLSLPAFYEEYNFIWWIISLVIFSIGTAKQCYQIIKQTEELTWNL